MKKIAQLEQRFPRIPDDGRGLNAPEWFKKLSKVTKYFIPCFSCTMSWQFPKNVWTKSWSYGYYPCYGKRFLYPWGAGQGVPFFTTLRDAEQATYAGCCLRTLRRSRNLLRNFSALSLASGASGWLATARSTTCNNAEEGLKSGAGRIICGLVVFL